MNTLHESGTVGESTASRLHRCFYAVKFSDEVTNYIAGIITAFQHHRADVAWTAPRNIHLTLRFLGEISEEQLRDAQTIPETDKLPNAFSLAARGLGAFPMLRAPRILWAGVAPETESDRDRLRHLQQMTESWARRLGLAPESRPYSPHITLGRIRRPGSHLRQLMDDLIARECDSGFCRIGELLLIESTLTSEGSNYEVVRRWELEEATMQSA